MIYERTLEEAIARMTTWDKIQPTPWGDFRPEKNKAWRFYDSPMEGETLAIAVRQFIGHGRRR